MELSKLYSEIIIKAWDDAEFKKKLLESPVEAIEQLIGEQLNIPSNKILKVEDQTNDNFIYFNIPAKPTNDDLELDENQLDMVAGGTNIKDALLNMMQFLGGKII